MNSILSKKQMSEEDIKLQYITPAITAKWAREKITMEAKVTTNVQITDGRINLSGNVIRRENPKKADYVLWLNPQTPLAIVEAKDNKHSVSHGLQQAMEYARKMDVPFAYSSNGDGFSEHDFLTGEERNFSLEQFPTPEELVERYKKGANGGNGLTPRQETILAQPYYTGQETYPPRYYQRIAVNRTLDAIARGQNRILLVMATGTGKTYTAFQIVYRLLQCNMKRKVLYLADRNILVDQSIQQDFAPLKKTIHKIDVSHDDPRTITSYEVYFSLYQQLVGDEGQEHFSELFKPDFFDLIIVDECHRGSAKEESRWRKILEYFNSATQIGMTATPKETKYVSNLNYFSTPVYSYSLKEGIEDGFLAPFKVINVKTDIGEGWRPVKGQLDIYGHEIPDRIYTNNDYDYNIVIEDRIKQVATEITRYLRAHDRMAKTIVFCASEDAAERMRQALSNLNKDMVAKNPDYVVRITGSDDYGKSKLDYFISVSSPYPVIATTSKLLSTGADCKMTKLIVLDEIIGSMTEFKQIIGRGTRLRESDGKTHFTVMDFRNVTHLFADPDWDGPIEIDSGFESELKTGTQKSPNRVEEGSNSDEIDLSPKPFVDSAGCPVRIIDRTVSVYGSDGQLMRHEDIVKYTQRNLLEEFPTSEEFSRQWNASDKKTAILQKLRERGIDLRALMAEQHMEPFDEFDFIRFLAYGETPRSRQTRAGAARQHPNFPAFTGTPRDILDALLEKYVESGIEEIEKIEVLRLNPFKKFGSPVKIVSFFGEKPDYYNAIKQLENALYS